MKKTWVLLVVIIIGLSLCVYGIARILSRNVRPAAHTANLPERIVSLAPNLTEILFALGLDEKIAAVSNGSNFPAEAAEKEKIGTFWQPNTEVIIAAKPDLVITLWFEQQKSVANSLDRLGYQVLTLKIEKIEELLGAIKDIGGITGCKQRAEKLSENIRSQLEDLRLKASNTKKVKVLWVIQAEPLRVAGRDSFVNELIELAGGENAIGDTIQPYPPISSEELLACKAEVIIQSAMGTSDLAGQQQAAEIFWNKWQSLPAVKNKKVYVIESDTVLRLGPRLPQGVKTIARYLHPEIFK
ncbi:MAG: ABC transporter substrate-binding protein [Planctomycetes bacterium]|nr:ABC transporter substrate-binding protein [Planctomycetota bacterium]